MPEGGQLPKQVNERFEKWKRGCLYDLTIDFVIPMSCAARVMESLIHQSLHKYRRKVITCRNAKCRTDHQEWFEVPPEVARSAVEVWKEFSSCIPYDTSGMLRKFWSDRLWEMRKGCFESSTHTWLEKSVRPIIELDLKLQEIERRESRQRDLMVHNYGKNHTAKPVLRRVNTV
ncbi:hypothetical protein BKA67DRAFT_584600, partial [Truncatella angustata]